MGTHFQFDDKRVLLKSFCRIMITFGNSLWVLSFNSLFLLFGFISKLIIRLCSSFRTCSNNKDDKIDLVDSPELEPFGFLQSEGFHEYLFGFQFQAIEEGESEEEEEDHDDGRNPESDYSAITDTPLVHSAIKFQTFPVKASRGFLVTPEDVSFTVKEMFVHPDNDSQMVSAMDVSVSDHGLETKQEEGVPGGEDVSSENREVDDEERGVVSEGDKSDESLSPSKEPKGRHMLSHFDRERDFSAFSGRTPFPVLDNEDEENDLDFLEQISDLMRNFEDDSRRNVASKDKAVNFNGENQESLELIDREIPFTTCNDYSTEEDDDDEEGYIIDFESHRELGFISERKSTGDVEASLSNEKNTFRRWDFDLEDENENEEEEEDGFKDILMQHRVMVEQLKMDAKSSRSGRLATIMEECETMKMDLKPLRLDERLDHKDHMNEIQKVYRSYTEKMKKLDILNYQTVHAISFLHMKDPSPSSSSSSHKDPTLKSPVSAIKTLIFSSMWPCKLRRIYSADPTVKSMAELHRDLETVYVGQACLSWEILQWQYDKSKELLLNDTDSQRSYGQAAIEFQQFQVLVHRFVENEAFQGSRVENYARDRCSLRTILQVPAIKDDDCLKNRTRRGEIKGAGSEEVEKKISIAALMDVIEESMRSFWEFIRADKEDATISISKSLLYNRGAEQQQQKKDQMELLNQLKTILQKKEKRVKGIVKSGNCLVRKFQKRQKEGRRREKDEWTEPQLIAQVELKLVGRVMNKTRLTQDQLIWCQKKLNDLTVIKGNIQIEPSFMLFPF
ncbi:uncharacterized protein LOC124927369 [Impatiens glandulifera]|uniref:uncharacterized protein LOC124927369 n=1 Tax=Impatiens glandulifera TaxID=253017 RepID=UPI001FB1997B|nr:uncharacterized protein LOC124927369 [Impatiens glandulifera]